MRKVLGHRARRSFHHETIALALDISASWRRHQHFPSWNYRYGIEDAPRWPYDIDANGHACARVPISPGASSQETFRSRAAPTSALSVCDHTRRIPQHQPAAANRRCSTCIRGRSNPDHPRIDLPPASRPRTISSQSDGRTARALLHDFRSAPMKEIVNVS